MKLIQKITVLLVVGLIPTSSATIINIPADYPTIQAGIAYSTDGDTVLVQPGVYYEVINYFGRNVTVGSMYLTTGDTSYISSTIIDAMSFGSAITFETGEDSEAVLTGFTITNGYFYNGGGIRCINNSSPTIYRNLITENTGYRNCGGIFCLNGSNPRILNNKIFNNESRYAGGGIWCVRSSPVIKGNTIRENSASSGGGVCLSDSSHAILTDNIIVNNLASRGAGIYSSGGNPVISGNIISNNSSNGDGGGVYLSYGSPVLIGNEINNNTSLQSGGGVNYEHAVLTILNNSICSNYSKRGGAGINCWESTSSLINNTIFDNIVEGGLFVHAAGIYMMRSNIVISNVILWNNLVNNNSLELELFESNVAVTYSNIQDGWPGQGNIDVDPLFRDTANGDFHLMSIACGDPYDSPCIDAGDPNILDSLLDCSWGLGTTLSDMGAYGGGDSALVGILEDILNRPDEFALSQNYPNPFNPTTTISFSLPEPSDISLTIYNILGQKVATLFEGIKQAGAHTITWNADDFPSGIYFARLEAEDNSKNIKMLLLK